MGGERQCSHGKWNEQVCSQCDYLEREALRQQLQSAREALQECADYFEDRMDVKDGDYGVPEANKEMRLFQIVQAALADVP